jgi:hypothetical protein
MILFPIDVVIPANLPGLILGTAILGGLLVWLREQL